eukprot:scaffold60761_cov58-Phaeocystis_antarctica.AAC.4
MDRDAGAVLAVAQSGVRTSRCNLASLLKLRLLPAAKVTNGSSTTDDGSRNGLAVAAVPGAASAVGIASAPGIRVKTAESEIITGKEISILASMVSVTTVAPHAPHCASNAPPTPLVAPRGTASWNERRLCPNPDQVAPSQPSSPLSVRVSVQGELPSPVAFVRGTDTTWSKLLPPCEATTAPSQLRLHSISQGEPPAEQLTCETWAAPMLRGRSGRSETPRASSRASGMRAPSLSAAQR